MISIGLFDVKPYDRVWFDRLARPDTRIRYCDYRLGPDTARLARGLDAVCPFVSDDLGARTIRALAESGVKLIALRCAGFNNVDLRAAQEYRIPVCRVPCYSPSAVAEHAAALLLTLNRHVHRAYNRTREHNFSLAGLTGFNLKGKTCGIVGTGRIGLAFAAIAQGFGMRLLACDPFPAGIPGLTYVTLEELLRESDVVSLHCPLSAGTRHMIQGRTLGLMKRESVLINTSRGALVDSRALLEALRKGQLGGAALDVYEEEGDVFFEDVSGEVLEDEVLSLLLTLPNVLITAHQGFLTQEALQAIAATTLDNIRGFFSGRPQNLIGGEAPRETPQPQAAPAPAPVP